MTRHTLLAGLLALSALLASPALAQAPATAPAPVPAPATPLVALPESQLRIAREVIESTGISRSFDGAFTDIALRIRQNYAAAAAPLLKDLDDTLVALLPEIRTRRAEIIERSARGVAVVFSEAELKEINAFFTSAVGKKYVNNQPQFVNQVFQSMETWMQQTSDFFLARLREEMLKKGHTL